MEPDFSYLASSMTTEELIERVDNRQKYLPETVEASVTELQYRKHVFSDDELRVIHQDIEAQRRNAATVDSRLGFFNSNGKKVIVKDPEAPLLYSRQAIYPFTVLCGALFGSIMMAVNISKTQKPVNAVWVIIFGIAFTALQIFVVSTYTNPGSGGSGAIFGGLVAAYILDFFFWKPFIGYSTFYRSRPIWIPLIIAVVVFGLIIALIIMGGKAG